MNFTFPRLGATPQFISSSKVGEIQTETNVLNQSVATTPSSSLFQESDHNVTSYCDKPVFATASSHISDSIREDRSSEWVHVSDRPSDESDDKKTFDTFTVAPSHTDETVGVIWQTKTMTQNASTMTDWETPENLCKSVVAKDNIEIPKSTIQNGFLSHGYWDSCSRIHLQRQGNAMAEYLARLQPSALPLSIQQFLNRLDIKPMKEKLFEKKPKIHCDFKPRNSEITVTTGLDGVTLYCCPECRMAYPEKDRLEAHLAVHKSERRFECNVCGACLKRKEHLDQHKRRHSEERPFVCEICCKGFKRNEHLRRHFVIHSGNKMYTCPECGKSFSRKDHLNKHAQTHITKRIKTETVDVPMISHTAV